MSLKSKKAKAQRFPESIVAGHEDFEQLSALRNGLYVLGGGQAQLNATLPILLQDAIDFVIDPVRTGRNQISELDNVEKTFIGLKVEHFIRDFLGAPKGLRDLLIAGQDVDIKNTISKSWMIPPETYRNDEPCLLIAIADAEKRFWLGLVVAREAYLNAPNRDLKRSVSRKGMKNILWLIEGNNLPRSRWTEINIKRFRELRKVKGGQIRATLFFGENLGKIIHRSILQSLLHDQLDYMKRIRGNGGARDLLAKDGISLISGTFGKALSERLGFSLQPDEFLAVKDL